MVPLSSVKGQTQQRGCGTDTPASPRQRSARQEKAPRSPPAAAQAAPFTARRPISSSAFPENATCPRHHPPQPLSPGCSVPAGGAVSNGAGRRSRCSSRGEGPHPRTPHPPHGAAVPTARGERTPPAGHLPLRTGPDSRDDGGTATPGEPHGEPGLPAEPGDTGLAPPRNRRTRL